MSTGLAVAAVTATLQAVLAAATNETVTAVPLDQKPPATNRINLFLYRVAPNAAWRNANPPLVKPNERGAPPLGLDLYYLLTTYAANEATDAQHDAHRLLGLAMHVLHDNPVLRRQDIETVLAESGLHRQVEHIRITPEPLSVDELSKLWTTFQTGYRTSVAYQASVVLIDSDRAARTALPVLARGPKDEGPRAGASLVPPTPTITRIDLPAGQPSARLDDPIALIGHRLDGTVAVRLRNRSLVGRPEEAIRRDVAPASVGANRIELAIPDDPAGLPVGFYSAETLLDAAQTVASSNAATFLLAPRIVLPLPASVARGAKLDVSFTPEIRAGQQALLLVGSRALPPDPATFTHAGRLTFTIDVPPSDAEFVRLRIDGIDSLLIVPDADGNPSFDPRQRIEIT